MGVIKQQTFQCGPAAPCTACTDGIRWSAMKFPRNQHLLLVKSKRFTIKVNLNFPGHWVIWWKWWNVHEISLKCPWNVHFSGWFYRNVHEISLKSAWNQPEISRKLWGKLLRWTQPRLELSTCKLQLLKDSLLTERPMACVAIENYDV